MARTQELLRGSNCNIHLYHPILFNNNNKFHSSYTHFNFVHGSVLLPLPLSNLNHIHFCCEFDENHTNKILDVWSR